MQTWRRRLKHSFKSADHRFSQYVQSVAASSRSKTLANPNHPMIATDGFYLMLSQGNGGLASSDNTWLFFQPVRFCRTTKQTYLRHSYLTLPPISPAGYLPERKQVFQNIFNRRRRGMCNSYCNGFSPTNNSVKARPTSVQCVLLFALGPRSP